MIVLMSYCLAALHSEASAKEGLAVQRDDDENDLQYLEDK